MDRTSLRAENAELVARLTAERKKSKLTQAEVARRLRRPQSFVAKYETGERRLTAIEFLHVCDALGVDPVKLIRGFRRS
jgi:transcriptional regulator with XRE-family HTH domain